MGNEWVIRFSQFGDIRIREVKGKYYVYLIEKDNEGNRGDHHVGPLDKVVKIGLGVLGGTPLTQWGRRDLNPRSPGPKPGILVQARLRPHLSNIYLYKRVF